MPIRLENRHRYPANWGEISHDIRFGRAAGRCECEGECGRGTHTGRCPNVHRGRAYGTGSIVILTTAHLDHVPENCDPANLRAMCQGCHLHYDRDHHAATARATRAAKLGLVPLPGLAHPWYHGGVPGLHPGDRILPPDITGTDRRLSAAAHALGLPHRTRTDVVYLARHQQHARVYAAFYPDGALYRVTPDTDPNPDPDAPEGAAMTTSAVITAVLRPRIVLAHRRLDSWLRLLLTIPKETTRA